MAKTYNRAGNSQSVSLLLIEIEREPFKHLLLLRRLKYQVSKSNGKQVMNYTYVCKYVIR